jgi:hypothetical protein
MNREGYRTPTEDAAINRETTREKLRAKYGVREGDRIRMRLKMGVDELLKERIMRVKVVDIHKYHITIERPAGYKESFGWDEFERRRID